MKRLKFTFLLLASLLVSQMAFSQTRISVSGTVANTSGKSIALFVMAEENRVIISDSVLTDSTGKYTITLTSNNVTMQRPSVSATLLDCNNMMQSAMDSSGTPFTGYKIDLDYCRGTGSGSFKDVTVFGLVSNNSGNQIPLQIEISERGVKWSDSVITDNRGSYNTTLKTNISWSSPTITVSMLDCNNRGVSASTSTTSGTARYNVNLDYCKGGSSGSQVLVYGKVSNYTGRGLPLTVTISEGTNSVIDSIITDSSGNYRAVVSSNYTWSQPKVEVSLIDCHDKTVTEKSNGGSPAMGFNIDLDYCKQTGKTCKANFVVRQAMNGRTPVPYQVIIYENSRGNGPLFYFWDFGDGVTSIDKTPKHSYSKNGPYYVCLSIRDSAGTCTDTICDSIGINSNGWVSKKEGFSISVVNGDAPSSIDEKVIYASVFPNPSNDNMTVRWNQSNASQVSVSISDLAGRVVYANQSNYSAGNQQLQLATNNLESGTYVLTLETEDGSYVQRIMKQ